MKKQDSSKIKETYKLISANKKQWIKLLFYILKICIYKIFNEKNLIKIKR